MLYSTLGPAKSNRSSKETFESQKGLPRAFESIREHSRAFESIREHSKAFESIREHSRAIERGLWGPEEPPKSVCLKRKEDPDGDLHES